MSPATSRQKSVRQKPTRTDEPAKEWYDYPEYYDLFFQEETPREIKFLKTGLQRYGQGPIQRIIEPACGSGRLVFELAKLGYDVAGFDLNENALEFLRKRLDKKSSPPKSTKTTWWDSKSTNVRCRPEHLQHIPSPVERRGCYWALKAVSQALRPGGLFFLVCISCRPTRTITVLNGGKAKRQDRSQLYFACGRVEAASEA